MKEIQKKDLPGVSGGKVDSTHVFDPVPIAPSPTYPQVPGGPIVGPTDPGDPLGDGKQYKQV